MVLYPFWEEDGAVHLVFVGHEVQGHICTSGLRPGNFEYAVGQFDNICFLVFYPAACHHAAMDAVVYRMVIFGILFVFPAIVIGVDKMGSEKIAKVFEFHK